VVPYINVWWGCRFGLCLIFWINSVPPNIILYYYIIICVSILFPRAWTLNAQNRCFRENIEMHTNIQFMLQYINLYIIFRRGPWVVTVVFVRGRFSRKPYTWLPGYTCDTLTRAAAMVQYNISYAQTTEITDYQT